MSVVGEAEPVSGHQSSVSGYEGAGDAGDHAIAEGPAHRRKSRPGPQHLKVVPRRSRWRGARARLTLAATTSLILIVSFGLVGLHVLMEQTQLRLDRLQTVASDEQVTYQRLRLEVDQLQAPSRIIAVAESGLGMKAPATVTYLEPVSPGSVAATGKPQAPSSDDELGTAALESNSPLGSADWPAIKSRLDQQP